MSFLFSLLLRTNQKFQFETVHRNTVNRNTVHRTHFKINFYLRTLKSRVVSSGSLSELHCVYWLNCLFGPVQAERTCGMSCKRRKLFKPEHLQSLRRILSNVMISNFIKVRGKKESFLGFRVSLLESL